MCFFVQYYIKPFPVVQIIINLKPKKHETIQQSRKEHL
jgi:hypothetical protein